MAPIVVGQQIIKQMTEYKFPSAGMVHTMSDYGDGATLAVALVLLLMAAILWIVSDFIEENLSMVKEILVVIYVISNT